MWNYFSNWYLPEPQKHLLYLSDENQGSNFVDSKLRHYANASSYPLSSHIASSAWRVFKDLCFTGVKTISIPFALSTLYSFTDPEHAISVFSPNPSDVCSQTTKNLESISEVFFKNTIGQVSWSSFFTKPFSPIKKLIWDDTPYFHSQTLSQSLGSFFGGLAGSAAKVTFDNVGGPKDICLIGEETTIGSRFYNIYRSFVGWNNALKPFRIVTHPLITYWVFKGFFQTQYKFYQDGFQNPKMHLFKNTFWFLYLGYSTTQWIQSLPYLPMLLEGLWNTPIDFWATLSLRYTEPEYQWQVLVGDPERICSETNDKAVQHITESVTNWISHMNLNPLKHYNVLLEESPENPWWWPTELIYRATTLALSLIHKATFWWQSSRIESTCQLEDSPNLSGRMINFLGGYARAYRQLEPYQKYLAPIAATFVIYRLLKEQYEYFSDKNGQIAVDKLKEKFTEMTSTLRALRKGEVKDPDKRFDGDELISLAKQIRRSKHRIIQQLDDLGLQLLNDQVIHELLDPLFKETELILDSC